MRGLFGVEGPIADYTWFGIAPIAAGVFGVPLAFAVTIIVSLLTPAPGKDVQMLVENVRYPDLKPARA
jgi:cation/acetate symporter